MLNPCQHFHGATDSALYFFECGLGVRSSRMLISPTRNTESTNVTSWSRTSVWQHIEETCRYGLWSRTVDDGDDAWKQPGCDANMFTSRGTEWQSTCIGISDDCEELRGVSLIWARWFPTIITGRKYGMQRHFERPERSTTRNLIVQRQQLWPIVRQTYRPILWITLNVMHKWTSSLQRRKIRNF